MVPLLIFIIILGVALFTLWICIQYQNIFIGILSSTLFLLLTLWCVTGVNVSAPIPPLDYTLSSFDYGLIPSEYYSSQHLIVVPGISNPVIDLLNDFDVLIHVHNEGGTALNSSVTTCVLDVYDPGGTEILGETMTFAPSYDYEYTIPGALLDKEGKYGYIIYCSGGTTPFRAGGINSYFIVKDFETCTFDDREQDYICTSNKCGSCDSTLNSYWLGAIFLVISIYILYQSIGYLRTEKRYKDSESTD